MLSKQFATLDRALRASICGLVAFAAVGFLGEVKTVLAQKAAYKTLPVHASLVGDSRTVRNARKKIEGTVKDVIRGDVPLSPNQSPFDNYYKLYFFPMLTQPDTMHLWPKQRQDFFRQAIQKASSPSVHDHLVNLTFEYMQPLANENYHPAVRYNAMLTIGMLNSKEAVKSGGKTPAIPLPDALPFMLNGLKDAKQIDAVRLAALVGIMRHMELDRQLPSGQRLAAGGRDQIVQQMLAIVSAKNPPMHQALRSRAIDVLGKLGVVKQNGDVALAIKEILNDQQTPASLRCKAAFALGRLDYPQQISLDVSEFTRNLGDFAVQACNFELKRIEDANKTAENKKKFNFGGGGGGMSGMEGMGMGAMGMGAMGMSSTEGMGSAMEGMEGIGSGYGAAMGVGSAAATGKKKVTDYKVIMTRRRLTYQLYCARFGLAGPIKSKRVRPGEKADESLGGIGVLAKVGPELTTVSEVVKGVDALMAVTNNPELDMDELTKEVRKQVRLLQAALPKSKTAPAEKVDEASDLPGGAAPPKVPATSKNGKAKGG